MDNQSNTGGQKFWNLTNIGLIASGLILVAAITSAYLSKDDTSLPDNSPEGIAKLNNRALNRSAGRPSGPPATPYSFSEKTVQTSFKLLDGKSQKLANYSGKVLVLDIWATWCGPCRQEIPHLIKIAGEYKNRGVVVVGLTTENPATDTQLVREFSRQYKINYSIGWADRFFANELMGGQNGIPQTLIIGKDGKVVKHFVGFNARISIPQMKDALDQAVSAGG